MLSKGIELSMKLLLRTHLKQLLFEILFIKPPKLPETQFAKVREEYLAFLLHLTLHVHHLLLRWGDAQRVQGRQQVLKEYCALLLIVAF